MENRYKLCLLLLLLSMATMVLAKKAATLEEKVSTLQDMLYKRPIVTMNMERWKDYVRSAPRNYSMVVMFTALSAGDKCPLCKAAYDEFYILANSYRSFHTEDKTVYFGMVEYQDAPQIFQSMNLNTAPVLYHFPAKGREKKDDQMDLQRFGIGADAMAKFVAEKTGVQIRVQRPINYGAPAIALFLVMLILGLLYICRDSLNFLYNRTFWAGTCVAIVFCFMSGQMWNHIQHPPFSMTNPHTRETSFVHGSTRYQLVSETYIVFGLYAVITAGMLLVLDAPKMKNNTYRKMFAIVGLGTVAVFFSLLISVFRMKYQSYPYHLLFN